MKKNGLPILFLHFWLTFPFGIVFSGEGPSEKNGEPEENWILVWNDEFEEKEIDFSKWKVEDAALFKNNELQYYTPDAVSLKNGCLLIETQRRRKGGREFTSGLVETKNRFSTTYGRFEIRAKCPQGQGIWPAIWLLPANGQWPPEIDIMELLGHEPDKMYMSNHFGEYPQNRWESENFKGPDFSEDFHLFSLEWSPSEILWLVDGQKVFSVSSHIPHTPFFLIINTAVGGDWPGNPDETTIFPQRFWIDYVRIYTQEVPGTVILRLKGRNGKIAVFPPVLRHKEGETISLNAVPDIGFEFSHFSGDIESCENPLSLLMDGDKTMEAHFKKAKNPPLLLSRRKPSRASSKESEGLDAKNAFDGNPGTRWSSEFSDPQWISVDLKDVYRIEAIRLVWETAFGKAFSLEVSLDGKNWETIHTEVQGSGGEESITGINRMARHVRLSGQKRKTRWGYSLWEFEIYGRK